MQQSPQSGINLIMTNRKSNYYGDLLDLIENRKSHID